MLDFCRVEQAYVAVGATTVFVFGPFEFGDEVDSLFLVGSGDATVEFGEFMVRIGLFSVAPRSDGSDFGASLGRLDHSVDGLTDGFVFRPGRAVDPSTVAEIPVSVRFRSPARWLGVLVDEAGGLAGAFMVVGVRCRRSSGPR